jgi:hypothetical protein
MFKNFATLAIGLMILSAYGLTPALSLVRARAAKCPIPEVPDGSQIVFLMMNRGGAMSSVTFGKKKWDITFVADVEIEPGDRPIYLIALSSETGLLRFSGAKDRINQIVSIGFLPMGFINIDASLAFWFETRECQVRGWSPHIKSWSLKKWWNPKLQLEYVKALAGGRLDSTIVERRVGLISIPSGQMLEREFVPGQVPPDLDGPKAEGWKQIMESYADGIVVIEPDDVVGPTELQEYSAFQLR